MVATCLRLDPEQRYLRHRRRRLLNLPHRSLMESTIEGLSVFDRDTFDSATPSDTCQCMENRD